MVRNIKNILECIIFMGVDGVHDRMMCMIRMVGMVLVNGVKCRSSRENSQHKKKHTINSNYFPCEHRYNATSFTTQNFVYNTTTLWFFSWDITSKGYRIRQFDHI